MTTPRNDTSPEAVEIRLLLEGVYQQYGFDFRDYAYPALRGRVWNVIRAEGLESVSELQARVLRDPDCLERLLTALTVHEAAAFRDPGFYLCLRERVLPRLRTYPFVRIWVAGCSTGEEVYSLAILLHEEGLYRRSRIYATDMAEAVVAQARAGIYPLEQLAGYTANYQAAGGRAAFSEYYTADRDSAAFNRSLRDNIVFAQHNLVTDASFNEFHLVLCRNVLVYFNRLLADRVQKLLYESLVNFGYLGLGPRETVVFSEYRDRYEELDPAHRIYRRII
jgi:chemotaxis protein methyltransferase CheR